MPNRILRDWTDSSTINNLSVHAERFFTRLIMKVDDTGRFFADARLLKANLFPLLLDQIREADISRWTAECEKAGLIALYNSLGKPYLEISNFKQRLRIMKSKFPERSADDGQMTDIRPPEEETETNPETKQETVAAQARDDFSYENFIVVFNELTRRHYKGDASSKGHFAARKRDGYKKEDFRRAIENCLADPFHKEKNYKYLTPEFILRPDKFDKFINATAVPEFNSPNTTLPKAASAKNIGASVTFKPNGKKGEISGIADGKYQLTFPDGSTCDALPIEIFITASAPKRNMAEPTALQNIIKEIRPSK